MSRILRRPIADVGTFSLTPTGITNITKVQEVVPYAASPTRDYHDIPAGTTDIVIRCTVVNQPVLLGIETFDVVADAAEITSLFEVGNGHGGASDPVWIQIESLVHGDHGPDIAPVTYPRLVVDSTPLSSGNEQTLDIVFFHG